MLLLPEVVDDYVGPDNPVRFIEAFVDGLDLAAAGFERVAAKETGRPGFDPADMLKLYIYGYVNRVRSSRRLDADGTRIKAVNNKDRNFTRSALSKFIREADEKLADYMKRLDDGDAEEERVDSERSGKLAEKIAAIRDKRARHKTMLEELDRTGEDQISLTDPDVDHAYEASGATGLFLQTLLETDLRISEFIRLRVKDVSLTERVIVVMHGKGSKRREVPSRREPAQMLRLRTGTRRAGFRAGNVATDRCPIPTDASASARRPAGRSGSIHLFCATRWRRSCWRSAWTSSTYSAFLGHENRHYAATAAATLRLKFDRVTGPAARSLFSGIQHERGDDAALLAADLLANDRGEKGGHNRGAIAKIRAPRN